MAKPKLTPQTPGEPVQDPAELTSPAAEAEAAVVDQPPTTETANPAAEAAPEVAADAPVADAGGLPDADTIDPATLKRPVMTKQGWLCPPSAEVARK